MQTENPHEHENEIERLAAIRDALTLLLAPSQVAELRIPNTTRGTVAGYFDDLDKRAHAAARWGGKAAGIYCMLNPVDPALLARANNRLVEYVRHTTSDNDIVSRHWLALDFDPVRPSGISSTDAEHDAALERGRECVAWLRSLGFSALILADSGNGGHDLARIDLPNDQDSTALIKRCLEAVALRFSDDTVSVDLSVFNPARIWKCYGTLACKGDSTPERPHRLARILEVSPDLTPEPRELLEQLAALAPEERKTHARQTHNGRGTFDLERWIADRGLEVSSPRPWQGGRLWIFSQCPWNPDHTNRAAYLVQFASGAIAAGCQHNGCHGKGWHDLRDVVEPGWRDRRFSGSPATDWGDLSDESPTHGQGEERPNPPKRDSQHGLRDSKPVLTRLSDIEAKPIHWLWPGRIPLGKVTVLDGDPGLGKSLVSLNIAARTSIQRAMPDGTTSDLSEPAGVVILSAEDDPSDTIRPRLEAAGADLSRINALIAIQTADDTRLPMLSDLTVITQAVAEVNAKLVIVDPLMAYLPGKVDSHRDQDIRRSLAPLAAFAAETGVAVLVIRHLNKAEGKNALYRGGGQYRHHRCGQEWVAGRQRPRRRRAAHSGSDEVKPGEDSLCISLSCGSHSP